MVCLAAPALPDAVPSGCPQAALRLPSGCPGGSLTPAGPWQVGAAWQQEEGTGSQVARFLWGCQWPAPHLYTVAPARGAPNQLLGDGRAFTRARAPTHGHLGKGTHARAPGQGPGQLACASMLAFACNGPTGEDRIAEWDRGEGAWEGMAWVAISFRSIQL